MCLDNGWKPGKSFSLKFAAKLLLKVEIFAVLKFLKNPPSYVVIAIALLSSPVFPGARWHDGVRHAQFLFSSVGKGLILCREWNSVHWGKRLHRDIWIVGVREHITCQRLSQHALFDVLSSRQVFVFSRCLACLNCLSPLLLYGGLYHMMCLPVLPCFYWRPPLFFSPINFFGQEGQEQGQPCSCLIINL